MLKHICLKLFIQLINYLKDIMIILFKIRRDKMNKFINTFMIVFTLVLLLVACSSKSSNSSRVIIHVELDLAAVYNDYSPDVEGAKKFAEIVEEKTNGEIKVNIFSNGTLGSEKDNFTELSSGDLDMALGGSAGIEMFAEEYMFFLAPFLIEDLDHLEEWFESDLHEDMTERMKENNVRHLGDIVRGARNTTANKPVETPEDLEELKFRLPETDTLVEVFSALGAKPTSVSLDELYSSLQTGVVDASEGPYEQIASNQLDEVQDYLIKTEHI